MDVTRQKTPVERASIVQQKGEALSCDDRGTEESAAKREAESLAEDGQLMERVCERENLKRALARVKRNKGAAGADRMTVGELPGHLKVHWPVIRERLLAGQYQPQPVRRVEIDKPGAGRASESLAFPASSIASSNKRCCKCWNRSMSRRSRNHAMDSGAPLRGGSCEAAVWRAGRFMTADERRESDKVSRDWANLSLARKHPEWN